jgi:two-component system response regulator AtoC
MQSPQQRVLVIDDDPSLLKIVGALLSQDAIHPVLVESADRAFEELSTQRIDAVITDLRMSGCDGMQVLARMAREWPGLPVVLLTAHGSVPLAVEAMKRGAADFVLKPFDRKELLSVVKRALTRPSEKPRPTEHPSLLGSSPQMRDLRSRIARAARGNATVLLRGETGTGKELAARMLHRESERSDKPFVRIHCAALPDTLLESELFGHEAGAFTGAVKRKPGRVELAHGGTLFLDEIGDVTPAVQVKLLHLLQEREFTRLGGVETLRADVRFVAATHRDVERMVEEGTFRADLFYRLHVVPIWCPPLRERPGDIELLSRGFAAELAEAHALPPVALSVEAVALLAAQPWPGNVRQLRNFVERLVVLSEGRDITAAEVAHELGRTGSRPPPASDGALRLDMHRRAAEREALEAALRQARGNRALAARILGISRRTLYNKLEKQGLL